jgi:hypothetical protein
MGAKRLLVVTIVLGVIAYVGLTVLRISVQNQENLVQQNNQLVFDINQFSTTAQKCESLSCLEQADGALSGELGSFVSTLEGSDRAGVSQDAINQVLAAARSAQHVTAALSESRASSLTEYQNLASQLNAEQSLNQLVAAQERFAQAVNDAGLG